jgi:hypothetical protein
LVVKVRELLTEVILRKHDRTSTSAIGTGGAITTSLLKLVLSLLQLGCDLQTVEHEGQGESDWIGHAYA